LILFKVPQFLNALRKIQVLHVFERIDLGPEDFTLTLLVLLKSQFVFKLAVT